jgi:hypothetical protein
MLSWRAVYLETNKCTQNCGREDTLGRPRLIRNSEDWMLGSRYGQVACSWDLRSSGYLHSVNWLFFYLHFGTTYQSNLQGSVKMGPTVCLETSVTYYQCTMYKTPEQLRSHSSPRRKPDIFSTQQWVSFLSFMKSGEFLKVICSVWRSRFVRCASRKLPNISTRECCQEHTGYSTWSLFVRTHSLYVCVRMLKLLAICMEAIPVCLLLNKPHSFSRTQTGLFYFCLLNLRVCYMLRPVLRLSSSGMSIQKSYKAILRSCDRAS